MRRTFLTFVAWWGLSLTVHAQYPPGLPGAPFAPGMAGMPGAPVAPGMPAAAPGSPSFPNAFTGAVPPGLPPEALGAFTPPGGPDCPTPAGEMTKPLPDNAFNDGKNDHPCYCWSMKLEYIQLWFKADSLPTLLTTGSAADRIPGAIGQANTQVLFGGTEVSVGGMPAGRLTINWFAVPDCFNLEGAILLSGERTRRFRAQSDTNGNPVLSRPYFDFTQGIENADPRALPNVERGATSDALSIRMATGELNGRWFLCNPATNGISYSMLVGARWLNLDERYSNQDTVLDVPNGVPLTLSISDSFRTINNFYGGQIGGELLYRYDAFSLGLQAKIAAGPNLQSINIGGVTSQLDFNRGILTVDRQGLYAQVSNVGDHRRTKFALLPELGVNLGFDLSDRIHFKLGYGILWLTDALRPGEQIDRVLSQPVLNPAVIPARPTILFGETTFWAQWVNIGLELTF